MAAVDAAEILEPGLLSSVQDRGRFGYGQFGVAASGAVDSFSFRVGNLLVDNPENEASVETTLFGLSVRALTDVAVAVTGADLGALLNDKPLKLWTSHVLKRGDILSFGGVESGCRSYLAIGGGISLNPVMGSKSTNLSSRFGGVEGRPLQRGDILSSHSPHVHLGTEGRRFPQEWIVPYGEEWRFRVIFGPQDDQFTRDGKKTFIGSSYQVSSKSDRTGIRLNGPIVERIPGLDESIISEGVVCGTIQIPGDGEPIIILSETVSGGYRKIATVISADLPLLGQLKPGDRVRFDQVSLPKAYKALQKMEKRIEKFKESLTIMT